MTTKVDVGALYAALDAERDARGVSWRQLAKEIGVSPSMLSRLGNGQRPDADTLDTRHLRCCFGQHAECHIERSLLEVETARQACDALLQFGWRHQRWRVSARIEHASHGIHNS